MPYMPSTCRRSEKKKHILCLIIKYFNEKNKENLEQNNFQQHMFKVYNRN